MASATERAAAKWQLIKTQGSATSAHSVPVSFPESVDPVAIQRYQRFACGNVVSFYTSSASGLWMLLQIPEIFVPLVATRKSESLPCLFMRYGATLDSMVSWLESDLTDEKSKGRISVEKVRCMHNNVSKLMEKVAQENPHLQPKAGEVWVSQKDMVVTQFAFVGLSYLFPQACGFRVDNWEQEMSDSIAFWFLVGHFLGVPDKFNLCSGTKDEVMELCRIMMREVYMPILDRTVKADETLLKLSQRMAVDTVTSVSSFVPVMTGRVVHQYWADVTGSDTQIDLTRMEKIRLSVVRGLVQNLLPIRWIKSLSSRMWFANYHRVWDNRTCVAAKLRSQDPEVKYKLCDLKSVN